MKKIETDVNVNQQNDLGLKRDDSGKSEIKFQLSRVLESLIVLAIAIAMMTASIKYLGELNNKINKQKANGHTDLLLTGAKSETEFSDLLDISYGVYSYKNLNECRSINKESRQIINRATVVSYQQFNSSCENIEKAAYEFHIKYSKDKPSFSGFSIFKSKDVEQYYPVYENNTGDFVYLGGVPATYDYIVVSKDKNDLEYDINTFNESLRLMGVK